MTMDDVERGKQVEGIAYKLMNEEMTVYNREKAMEIIANRTSLPTRLTELMLESEPIIAAIIESQNPPEKREREQLRLF